MKSLLIATHNQAKLEELKIGLKDFENQGIKLLTLNDVGVEEKPDESGKTFRENSRIKTQFYGRKVMLPTIGDDGGLVIPYLNNGPGVKSRRWPGYEATDEELINYTLLHLRGVAQADRTAFLVVNLCFFDPRTNKTIYEEEKIKGHIAEKPSNKPTNGYPFRALFIVDEFNKPRSNRSKYYDELTEEEHDKINHRLKALKRLVKKIKIYLCYH